MKPLFIKKLISIITPSESRLENINIIYKTFNSLYMHIFNVILTINKFNLLKKMRFLLCKSFIIIFDQNSNILIDNYNKVFLIRGGKDTKTYSPGTETITTEEYMKDYGNEINLDESDDINRLNRAYTKPKKVPKGPGRSLKDTPLPAPEKLPTTDNNIPVVDKPIIKEPSVNRPFIDEPILDTPVTGNKDNQKDDYKNIKPILDDRKDDLERIKEEFRRDNKNIPKKPKIKSNNSIKIKPASSTNKEIFDNFVLKNKIIIEFISYFLNFVIIYFYLCIFKKDIIMRYKLIYINYKNKNYKKCIDPTIRLLLHICVIFRMLYFGPSRIKSIFLKLCYYFYICITFLKGKKFIMDGISKIIYPFICARNIYFNLFNDLFQDLFNYVEKLCREAIEILIYFLLNNPIGQIINRPFINTAVMKLYYKFIKNPIDLACFNVVESALNTFFVHKTEIRALHKMNRMFEEYKNYCLNNNKKDAIVDYVMNDNIKLRLISQRLTESNFNDEYFIKFNKLMCAIYNIKKNYATQLKFITFSDYKNFKPGTFLSKLFGDISKFKVEDKFLENESKSLEKLILEGNIPKWFYSYITVGVMYYIDLLKFKKLFSIHIPEYIINDKNFCTYLNYRKTIFNSILSTSVIFISCLLFVYLKKRIPKNITNYIIKKIESIKKSVSDFYENFPLRYSEICLILGLILVSIFLFYQYFKFIFLYY